MEETLEIARVIDRTVTNVSFVQIFCGRKAFQNMLYYNCIRISCEKPRRFDTPFTYIFYRGGKSMKKFSALSRIVALALVVCLCSAFAPMTSSAEAVAGTINITPTGGTATAFTDTVGDNLPRSRKSATVRYLMMPTSKRLS